MMSKERPILFSGPMIQAILSGRKTQTRRVIKLRSGDEVFDGMLWRPDKYGDWYPIFDYRPYYNHMHLWVRESFTGDWRGTGVPARGCVNYRADGEIPEQYREGNYWRSPIHMPRWASRLTLEVTNVKVERVQDISEADAKAEGWGGYLNSYMGGECMGNGPRTWFHFLWDSINGARPGCSWADNPFVWCIEFRRI